MSALAVLALATVTPAFAPHQACPVGTPQRLTVRLEQSKALRPGPQGFSPRLGVAGPDGFSPLGALVMRRPRRPVPAKKGAVTLELGVAPETAAAMKPGRTRFTVRLDTKDGPLDAGPVEIWIVAADTRLTGPALDHAFVAALDYYVWAKDQRRALELAEHAHEERPYSFVALRALGRVYEEAGYLLDAAALYERAAHATMGESPQVVQELVDAIRRVDKKRKRRGSKPRRHSHEHDH